MKSIDSAVGLLSGIISVLIFATGIQNLPELWFTKGVPTDSSLRRRSWVLIMTGAVVGLTFILMLIFSARDSTSGYNIIEVVWGPNYHWESRNDIEKLCGVFLALEIVSLMLYTAFWRRSWWQWSIAIFIAILVPVIAVGILLQEDYEFKWTIFGMTLNNARDYPRDPSTLSILVTGCFCTLAAGMLRWFCRAKAMKLLRMIDDNMARRRTREDSIQQLARDHAGEIRALDVACSTTLTLTEAEQTLENMARTGACRASTGQNGEAVYRFV